jgi:hypothetical protein
MVHGMVHWSHNNGKAKAKISKQTLPSLPANVVTDYGTTVLRLNPSVGTDKPATDRVIHFILPGNKQTNSAGLSPRANYTD